MKTELEFRILQLEKEVRSLKMVKEFNEKAIPSKYRKAFPANGGDPFYRAGPFKPKTPSAFCCTLDGLGDHVVELDIPTNPKELKAAKKRMKERGRMAKKELKAIERKRNHSIRKASLSLERTTKKMDKIKINLSKP